MDKPRKYNVCNFVGTFSDISVNDSLISSNALQPKASISSFPFKCEDEQETDEMRKEINGIGGSSVEVHDVRMQSNSWCLCSVSEEVKVTNCYSERVCVIKQENPGNDSEQDPLFVNEDDLSRKIILERNDSMSPFFSKIKREKPDNELNQDPLLLTEQDYVNFAKNGGKDMKIKVEDVNKTTLHLKDLRVVLERIDTNVLLPSLIEKENTGNDLEHDPLFINEDDLSREIILERNDSTSPFFSKFKKEKPDNDLNQDPLLLTEQDYINFAKNGGKDMKIKVEDVNKTTLHLKDLRVVLERIDTNVLLPSLIEKENTDVLAASSVNGNEKERSLAKKTTFPSTKEQSRDVVNILEKKGKELAHNEDSVGLFSKVVINPQFSKNECQGKSTEQSIVCGNCQRTKHYSHVPFFLEAQNNNVNKNCECRSNERENQKMEVTSHTKRKELIKRKSLMQFMCSYCGNTFPSKMRLNKHTMTHTGKKPFHCSYCEYTSSHKGHLRDHIFTHTDEKPFKCSYCEYRCSRKGSLNTHILTHTGVKPFKCSYCEFRCITKGQLKRHILTHTGVKPFKCSYCEFRCITKGQLKRHTLTHTGVKPFKCSYCEYRCSEKGTLKTHILTHTGVKPFKCAYCEYRCITKGDLKKHILTHMGVKPFKCSYCEYICSLKGNLKKHILTHTAVKPFQCSYCEYTCIQKCSLRKHVKKHSGVKLLWRSDCRYNFINKTF